MPQRQHYSEQRSKLLSAPHAVLRAASDTQSAPYVMRTTADSTNYNPPRQSGNSVQSAPRQTYQSNPPYCGYQKANEKEVYQVDKDAVENQLKGFYNTFEEKNDDVTYSDKGFDKIAVNFVGIETSCIKCRTTFPSKLKLHNHLKNGCLEMSSIALLAQAALSISIIASKTIDQSFGLGLVFRGWIYATAPITLTPEHLPSYSNLDSIACLNTRCEVTLVDKAWLLKRLPMQKINTMSTPLRVRGIGSSKHNSGEYAILFLYFSSKDNASQQVYASLTYKIHLIKGLRTNLLIGNNIMSLKNFIIDIKKKIVLIESCDVTVLINARQRGQFLTRKLFASQETVVPPRSEAMILLIPLSLPDNQDFLFHPAIQANLTLFTYLVNHQTSKVLVRNNSSQMLYIL